jgi:hypothetical protein
MKVIEKGRKQRGWSKEFRCTGDGNGGGGCSAYLLVEQPDIFQTSSSARDETDYFNTFKCSECGVLTDIKARIPFTPPSQSEWKKRNKAREIEEPVVDSSATDTPTKHQFWECEACRAKPGSPLLCPPCLHNRTAIADLKERIKELA